MCSVNKGTLYKELQKAYSNAYSQSTSKENIQKNVNSIWNSNKNSNVHDIIQDEIIKLNRIASERRIKVDSFWIKARKISNKENLNASSIDSALETSEDQLTENLNGLSNRIDSNSQTTQKPLTEKASVNADNGIESFSTVIELNDVENEISHIESSSEVHDGKKDYQKPAQEKLRNEILLLVSEISIYKKRESCGLMTDDMVKELQLKSKRLDECQALLKRIEAEMLRQRGFRSERKRRFEKACEEEPELKKKLGVRDSVGKPSLEEDQPHLHIAIIELALRGSAAHERRRDEIIRTIKTLDDLVEQLHELGFNLSRSATYLRLLPKLSKSIEGKRHVHSVPVRLIRSSNDLHKQHVDSTFAMTTISHLDELASMLGPNEIIYLSQDDKARVPLGLTAAKLQAPLMMHMQYRVRLPDHDFVIGKGHKLIPSVYGFCEVKVDGLGDRSAISYSGPTFVAIRSAKHSSSTAFSHARDIEKIFENEYFQKFTLTEKKEIDEIRTTKPIFINTVDGGPDENVRHDKVIRMYVHLFLKYDLDAVFVACNAPGRSAFNRVERRMAVLSKALSGVILPHDHYGTHLETNGSTKDIELEKLNFSYAGKALADIWSETVIDEQLIEAQYVDPDMSEIEDSLTLKKDGKWFDHHVIQSQYLLQILKCSDRRCCKERRSSVFKFLPSNGLPFPIPIKQSNDGLKITGMNDVQKFASLFATLSISDKSKIEMMPEALQKSVNVPYDMFCPSVQTKLETRTCSCRRYFSSVASMKSHQKANVLCKKSIKAVKPLKILGIKGNEKLVLIQYDQEEKDVEWVYDIDCESDEVFVQPPEEANHLCTIEDVLTPVWEKE